MQAEVRPGLGSELRRVLLGSDGGRGGRRVAAGGTVDAIAQSFAISFRREFGSQHDKQFRTDCIAVGLCVLGGG